MVPNKNGSFEGREGMSWTDSRQHCSLSFFYLFPGKARENMGNVENMCGGLLAKNVYTNTVLFFTLHDLSPVKADMTMTLHATSCFE